MLFYTHIYIVTDEQKSAKMFNSNCVLPVSVSMLETKLLIIKY
jgi:hypothetical protein